MIDVALSIERLIAAAKYGGSVTANDEASFNALRWEDSRPKPTWVQIVAISNVPIPPSRLDELKSKPTLTLPEVTEVLKIHGFV